MRVGGFVHKLGMRGGTDAVMKGSVQLWQLERYAKKC